MWFNSKNAKMSRILEWYRIETDPEAFIPYMSSIVRFPNKLTSETTCIEYNSFNCPNQIKLNNIQEQFIEIEVAESGSPWTNNCIDVACIQHVSITSQIFELHSTQFRLNACRLKYWMCFFTDNNSLVEMHTVNLKIDHFLIMHKPFLLQALFISLLHYTFILLFACILYDLIIVLGVTNEYLIRFHTWTLNPEAYVTHSHIN